MTVVGSRLENKSLVHVVIREKARHDNRNLIQEPAIILEGQPIVPRGTAGLLEPSVPLFCSSSPQRQTLTGNYRTTSKKVNSSLNQTYEFMGPDYKATHQ